MANDSIYRVAGTNVPGCKILYAQIFPNGALTPTIGENYGNIIESVAWSATGVIIATLSDTYLYGACFPHLQLAAATNQRLGIIGFTYATTRLLTMSIMTGATPSDVAADPGNIIHLDFRIRDSSAQ